MNVNNLQMNGACRCLPMGGGSQTGSMLQMMQMMMTLMMALMSAQMGRGDGYSMGMGNPGFGMGSNGNGGSGFGPTPNNFLGGPSPSGGNFGGGARPSGGLSGQGTGNANSAAGAAGLDTSGAGGRAVEIAKSFLGQKSGNIKMNNYSAAGGMDNNCADFVSACLANAGLYQKQSGDASVATLKSHLLQQGWREVPKAQAQPGDVAVFNGSQHVELVASRGAGTLIGSNNKGSNVQTVSTDSGNWGSVVYLHKG